MKKSPWLIVGWSTGSFALRIIRSSRRPFLIPSLAPHDDDKVAEVEGLKSPWLIEGSTGHTSFKAQVKDDRRVPFRRHCGK